METPRAALGNISNQSSPRSSLQRQEKPRSLASQTKPGPENGSRSSSRDGIKSDVSVRRRLFPKQYGDLSHHRPISPPLPALKFCSDSPLLSPGEYVEDVPDIFFVEDSTAQEASTATPGLHEEQCGSHKDYHPLPPIPAPKITPKPSDSAGPIPPLSIGQPAALNNSEKEPIQSNADTGRNTYYSTKACPPQEHFNHNSESSPHHSRPIPVDNLGPTEWCHPADVFLPLQRTYPPMTGQEHWDNGGLRGIHTAPPVHHLNTSTTWKHLNCTDAEQLLQVHQAFQATVTDLLAGHIADLYQNLDPTPWVAIAAESSVPIKIFRRRCVLDWSHLVDTMKQKLGLPMEIQSAESRLDHLLHLYLSNTDSFGIHDSKADARSVYFVLQYHQIVSSHLLRPVVEAIWIPDYLSFPGVDRYPREGDLLIIKPFYGSLRRDSGRWIEWTSYTLITKVPWLQWNDSIDGWKGTVPRYSELRDTRDDRYGAVMKTDRVGGDAIVNLLRIHISALKTQLLDSGIKVERSINTCLTIKVRPSWVRERASSEASATQSVNEVKEYNDEDHIHHNFSNRTDCELSHETSPPPGRKSFRRITPSMNHWASRSQQFEKDVMSKVRDAESLPALPCLDTDGERCSTQVHTISEMLERYSLSDSFKTHAVHDTDIQAYPVALGAMRSHQSSHMLSNPGISSMHAMPPNIVSETARASSISSTLLFNEPATAELMRIAQTLHHQAAGSKRATSETFEQSPSKRNRQKRLDSRCSSTSACSSVYPSPPHSVGGTEEDDDQISLPMSAGISTNRDAVVNRPGTPNPELNIQNLYIDPNVQYDQIVLGRALLEIGDCSPQERKQVYEALKRSIQDSEKISNQRLGVSFGRDFTDSEYAGSECDSSIIGTEIQENTARVENNHEGTESPTEMDSHRSSKPTSRHMSCASHEAIRCDLADNGEDSVTMSDLESRRSSESGSVTSRHMSADVASHNEVYLRCLDKNGGHSVHTSEFESASDSDYVSESSEFEKDPTPADDGDAAADGGKEEKEDLAPTPVQRRVPLMGLFGRRNSAARWRTIANRNAARRHLDMRVQRPCYGCEVKGATRLGNGEVVSGAKW